MSSARRSEQLLDPRAQLAGPRLGTEQARAQAVAAARQRLAEAQRVGRRAGQDVGAQVAHQRDLPRGHAAGDRHHGGAELDRALVDAEAAGEQPVTVGVVHHAAGGGAGAAERPGAHPRPQPQVGAGVGDQGGAAAGTAGAVHGDHLGHGHGHHAERVGVPQVLLLVVGSRGRSATDSPPPPVTPACRSRAACGPPAASSRFTRARSRSSCSRARSDAGMVSASGSNMVWLGVPEQSVTWSSMPHMTSVPDRSRVRLPGISSRAYEHPADRSALVALRKLTGFDVLLRRLASLFSDRSLRLMFLASSVKASERQFPQLLRDAARRGLHPGPADRARAVHHAGSRWSTRWRWARTSRSS